MNRAALLTLILLASGTQATNAGIKILTPNADSLPCIHDRPEKGRSAQPGALWVGYGLFSGVAQGTGIDFLRNFDIASLTLRLDDSCLRQPDKSLSLAAEELARSLIMEQQSKH
jgi:hypothetical protein